MEDLQNVHLDFHDVSAGKGDEITANLPHSEHEHLKSWDKRRTEKEEPPKLPRPLPGFRSTVDSWNRERDRRRVEAKLGLREEGDDTTVFVNKMDEEMVIAIGYRRVLYGDHGPYLEFTYHQMCWEAFTDVLPNKPSHAYYDERWTPDNHVKAYEQRRTVHNRPNPPPGEWSVNNNRYDTGYADYQPGFIYISADCLGISGVPSVPSRPPTSPMRQTFRRRQRGGGKAPKPQPTKASEIQTAHAKLKPIKVLKAASKLKPSGTRRPSGPSKQSRPSGPRPSKQTIGMIDEMKELMKRLDKFNPVKPPKLSCPKRKSRSKDNSSTGCWVWIED